MTAKFIVIEGLEGAGKSTAIALCQEILKAHQVNFVNTREPGGTPLAESLRNLVKATHQEIMSAEAELLIMYAARAQLLTNVIRPALANGQWVLGDRHNLSSLAYQGGGRELDSSTLNALSNIVLKGLKPDLTIYLDIDPAVGLARAAGRGALDRIEQEQLSFFERTRAQYLAIAASDPSIKVVQAGQEISAVHQDIRAVLTAFLVEQGK
ncbi:dTMP kinase [Pseudoalteromonas tunicata]|jgi:dTMP kinase|uniref:Thymidylate kinase n=1 Tax=Pseudoalteromonas tunicata D2 TaxID=87626 RepID=A4CAL2_9GAMM|nr:dTMP kinase [Pseudoalteromonas tunicata]ATC94966.1 dTMP kinase [Pseudoalteromonas tunicata]AXT30626.1 dTMP kinase [Pseudoalteromonas tunicata]EAR28420.1 thymidylate kinase [Pseudoalteromonas tunicata D2]